ncbi:MAG: agmatinase family protein [bacterium]|nr:agmatinase family protein [bacterium]
MTETTSLANDIYDLPSEGKNALVQILPMPFDATTSYKPGASRGPEAILAASKYVDLCDMDVGEAYKAGIHLVDFPNEVIDRNQKAREAVYRIREAHQNDQPADSHYYDEVNEATHENNKQVHHWAKSILANEQIPVVLGGDHSVPFGLIKACAEHYAACDIGILHIDAHCDLRKAYEGFTDSHASIMYNVQANIPSVSKITQVGIRDFCAEELEVIQNSNGRITTFFDKQIRPFRLEGRFLELCPLIIDTLPDLVYLSFDIDGLEPSLCPNTGTPVPGGLSFDEIIALMDALASSGKTIIGMDLCEVAPPPDTLKADLGGTWDANIGARVLYKMIGFSLISQNFPGIKPPSLPAW